MSTKTQKLSGAVALVTGGSRGIGAAIAKRLATDGASVAITYSSAPQRADEVVRAIESGGGRAVAFRADSSDAGAVKTAVSETVRVFGGLDILVNNAGIATIAPLDQFSLEDFDRLVAVNIRAVFVGSQEASRHMKEGGRIITIGSVNADRMPFAGGSVYAMSKAAVAGLTRGMARDLGPRGITVNAVQPGPVDTDMNPASGPFSESLKALMALPRYGHPDEIAGMVSYLAGPEAGFITGACLTIDGGFAA
ncbi:MAG TPA: 3-oxoacyl-ACP reductase family protein [Verrucomicrobiales bacterium]|jgi:3-oxoacyl-[acyl-carrier protein] reductase|nr:3-oxoacyl-ACP reductase family protein [Verrucomicrobiales bacterium]